MALINCPECKKEVSEHSLNCPNCGYPINFKKPQNIVVKKNEGCFLQTLNIGCLIIVVIFGAVLAVSFLMAGLSFFNHTNKKEPVKTEKVK